MGGPQVQSAIDCSQLIRRVSPTTPHRLGGYFPTLYTNAAVNAPYVDYAIRGAGENALAELLAALPTRDVDKLGRIAGFDLEARRCRCSQRRTAAPETSGLQHPYRMIYWAIPGRIWHARFSATALPCTRLPWGAGFAVPFAGWPPCLAAPLPAARRATGARPDLAQGIARGRLVAIFRSPLLRSRGGHDSAAGGACQDSTAVVVLCAGGCVGRHV